MASIPGDFLQIGVYNAMQALCWSQVRFDKGYDSISNDTCPIIYHLHRISLILLSFTCMSEKQGNEDCQPNQCKLVNR